MDENKERQFDKIVVFAMKLEGSTVGKQNSPYSIIVESVGEETGSGKGSFGQYLEKAYFGIRTNNESRPDFWPIPLELKASPLKRLKNGDLTAKERIVLNIINYREMAGETFENSHFKFKNESILLVWYVHDKNLENPDKEIDLVGVWKCLEEDFEQIKQDWETIKAKICSGHAEDISEGDTFLLGACTKGSTAATSLVQQPFSPVLAKQRALCFKHGYASHIYDVMQSRRNKSTQEVRFMANKKERNLEQAVLAMFEPYIGKTSAQIEDALDYHVGGKSRLAYISRRIIGFSKKNESFYEFDVANIQIKTIRLEKNGKNKESMSFRNVNFCEIVGQDWEDSDLYEELTSKFIMVIFRRESDGMDYVLDNVRFWNMPQKDIDVCEEVWERTKYLVMYGDYNHFPKKSDNPIIHVRPKGEDGGDLMPTPQGGFEKKKCFFLNREYVLHNIVEK